MAILERVKVVMVMVTAVLLVAPVSSSDISKFETENSWKNINLPASTPALTLIRFSTVPDRLDTALCFQIQYLRRQSRTQEQFTFSGNDNEKNLIAVLYKQKVSHNEKREVVNMLTGKTMSLSWSISRIRVWSNHSVTWEVAHNNFTFLTKTTAVSTTPTISTALPLNQPSVYLNPAFLALAALCVILAIITLVLSVLQCYRCASSRSGLQGTSSSRDDTTFKSTETLIRQQIPYPYNYNGRGSLHVSENSLYGVL